MTSKATTTYPFYIMFFLREAAGLSPFIGTQDEALQAKPAKEVYEIAKQYHRTVTPADMEQLIADCGGRIVWPEDEAEDDVPFSFAEETCTCVHDCDNEPSFGMRWLTWYEGEAKGEEPIP